MKNDATRPEWDDLRRRRTNRRAALAAGVPLFVGFVAVNGLTLAVGPGALALTVLQLAFLGLLFVAAGVAASPTFFACPECQCRFETEGGFDPERMRCKRCGAHAERPSGRREERQDVDSDGWRERERENQKVYVDASNDARAEMPTTESSSPPVSQSVLTRLASTRGWEIVHSDAIAGEVAGIRIAVEHDREDDGCTYVDADAAHVDEASLAALRGLMTERVPRARVVTVGPILRIEIPGPELDSDDLDVTLDAVEHSLPRRVGGAYRS